MGSTDQKFWIRLLSIITTTFLSKTLFLFTALIRLLYSFFLSLGCPLITSAFVIVVSQLSTVILVSLSSLNPSVSLFTSSYPQCVSNASLISSSSSQRGDSAQCVRCSHSRNSIALFPRQRQQRKCPPPPPPPFLPVPLVVMFLVLL